MKITHTELILTESGLYPGLLDLRTRVEVDGGCFSHARHLDTALLRDVRYLNPDYQTLVCRDISDELGRLLSCAVYDKLQPAFQRLRLKP